MSFGAAIGAIGGAAIGGLVNGDLAGAQFGAALGGSVGGAVATPTPGGLSGHDALVANRQHQTHYHPNYYPSALMQGYRRAGLNPILAFNAKGAGGVPAGGSVASADKAQRQSSSAQQIGQQLAIAKLTSEIDLNKSVAEKNRASASESPSKIELNLQLSAQAEQNISKMIDEGINLNQKTDVATAQEKEINQRILNLKQTFKLDEQQLEKLIREMSTVIVKQNVSESDMGEVYEHMQRASGGISSAVGIAGAVIGLKKLKSVFYNPQTTGTFSKKTGEIFK